MRHAGKISFNIALFTGCVYYLVSGIELATFWQAVLQTSPIALGVACLFLAGNYCVMGVRLQYACEKSIPVHTAINAQILAVGMNVFLPAKLGEVAKAVYLRHYAGYKFGKSMGCVFWERFFDLNMLLLLGLFYTFLFKKTQFAFSLSIVTVILWALLLVLRFIPASREAIISLLYFKRLQSIARDAIVMLSTGMHVQYLCGLFLLTSIIWVLYFMQYVVILQWSSGFELAFYPLLAVFFFGAGGMAIPVTPGSIGVYEAAVVWALTLQGIPKEEALAAGIVLHAFCSIPAALYALGLLSAQRIPLRDFFTPSDDTVMNDK